ncbi:hypothetical protein EDB19DRAFT_987019 [Suillus lakei]|nr:hypothetical protein EDB19DRAFT_987019 [Suillus lakei]
MRYLGISFVVYVWKAQHCRCANEPSLAREMDGIHTCRGNYREWKNLFFVPSFVDISQLRQLFLLNCSPRRRFPGLGVHHHSTSPTHAGRPVHARDLIFYLQLETQISTLVSRRFLVLIHNNDPSLTQDFVLFLSKLSTLKHQITKYKYHNETWNQEKPQFSCSRATVNFIEHLPCYIHHCQSKYTRAPGKRLRSCQLLHQSQPRACRDILEC